MWNPEIKKKKNVRQTVKKLTLNNNVLDLQRTPETDLD